MNIFHSLDHFETTKDTVTTTGTFDGVHIGHQTILNQVKSLALKHNLASTLLSFFPHPRMVLQENANIKLLNTIEEKQQLLNDFGLDNFVVIPFTKEFSRMSSTEYIREVLTNGLKTKKLVIGYDHQFGRNREGSFEHLKECEHLYGFEVEEISAKDIDSVTVSSTKIRKALNNGDIETANRYLGYPYMLTGTVVEGKRLGITINYPTANLYIEEDYKLIPKTGSYVVSSTINENMIYGMMNIGYNPTVNGSEKTIEVHFFNFKEDLYGKKIQVRLLKRLRDEQKFSSIKTLKKQLDKDKLNSEEYIASLSE